MKGSFHCSTSTSVLEKEYCIEESSINMRQATDIGINGKVALEGEKDHPWWGINQCAIFLLNFRKGQEKHLFNLRTSKWPKAILPQ